MQDILPNLIGIVCFAALALLLAGALCAALHSLLSQPMRRRDRALFFLDLLETVVDRGQPVEQAILAAAENEDRSIGVGYFIVAAHIEGGARLGEALDKDPAFLPPQVNAMLQTGEKLGNFKKVLPACREVLRVAPDAVRTTMHYMVTVLLLFAPIAIFLVSWMCAAVLPRFQAIAAGTGTPEWPVAAFVAQVAPFFVGFEVCLFFFLIIIAKIYLGGPAFVRWFQYRSLPVVDWIAWRVPWKRKQLLRAFSAMLAVLLDGGVPEGVAVQLAGECTANEICRRRAQRVIAALQGGVKLQDAVREFDAAGELHWRLTNATHAKGGFLEALRGWHQALDARASQHEETAAQGLTSGLVIINGVIVGLVAVGLFGALVSILKTMIVTL